MRQLKLSVIIPAYNEAGRIGPTLSRVVEYLSGKGFEWELVVVDDGSTDATRDLVREAAQRDARVRPIENGTNRGKGYSVRNGFLNTSGEYALFSDADLSTPIEELDGFLLDADGGADIVIGSRAMRDSKILKRQPVYRMVMGKTFNRLVRALTVRGISDTQCGFKLFRRSVCEPQFLGQKIDHFSFDAELLFLAQKKGLKIVERPVRWINSPQSKVDPVWDSLRMLLDILKVRWSYLTGGYQGF